MSKSKKRLRSERLEELFSELQTPSTDSPPQVEGSDTTPTVVRFQCDAQGHLVVFDPALGQILGYADSELPRQTLDQLIPGLAQHPLYKSAQNGEQEVVQIEVQVRDRQGRLHPAVLYLSPGNDHDEHGWTGMLQFQQTSPLTPGGQTARLWRIASSQEQLQGLLLRGKRLSPAQKPLTPAGQQALRQKTPVAQPAQANQPAALAAPVPLSDATALLEIVDPSPNRIWDEDERQLAAEIAQQLGLALENARLFQAAQRRATELQALLNLSRAVAQQLKLHDIYLATDQALQQLMRTETLLIGLVNEEQGVIDLVYGRDRDAYTPEGIQIPLEEGLSGYVIRHSQPVLIQDFEDTDALPFQPRTIRTSGDEQVTRSAVAAPLRIGDRTIGMISVQSYLPNAYTSSDLNLLTGVADQVALAIQNARLFEQTQAALTTTAQLYQLTAAFNAASTYEEVLRALRDFLGHEVHTVILSLFDHPWDDANPPEWMIPVAYLSDLDIPPQLANRRYPVSEFPEVQRIRGQGDFIPDTSQHDWSETTHHLYADLLQARAAAFVPLVIGGRWIGFLNLLYREPHTFSAAEQQQIIAVSSQAAVAVESLRALENTRRQAAELEALNRLAYSLSTSLDLNMVYRTALEGVQRLFDIDAGLITSAPSPDATTLTLVVSFGLPAPVERQLRTEGIDVQHSACGWTFQHERPVVLPDLERESYPFVQPLLQMGFRAYFGIPLRYGGRNLGTLCLFSKKPHFLSQRDIQLMETVGREVAVAAENARLYQQAQAALAETEHLYQISRALSQAHTYTEILDVLRTQTPLGEGASNISLNFFNRPWTDPEDIPEWSIVAARWTRLPTERLSARYPLRHFPAARLLSPDEPLLIPDVANDPRLDEQTRALYLHQFQAKSTVFFPLVVGGRWIGYLNAIYETQREFTDEELRFLQGALAQAAITLENLILLERSQRRAEAERTVREIAAEIFKAPRTEDALQTAARLLAHALGVSHAQIHLLGPWGSAAEEPLSSTKSQEEDDEH